MSISFLAVIATLLMALMTVESKLSCISREGDSLPWFTLIKYPKNITNNGARYAYLDSTLGSQYKVIFGSSCDTESEALPNTIDSINNISEDTLNLMIYNDESPDGKTTSSGAHAKGIIAFDNATKTGVYIMHSIPKYPSLLADGKSINYSIPSSAYEYGQNAYCVSIDEDILSTIIGNFPIEKPHVYYSTGFFTTLPTNSDEGYKVITYNLLNGDPQWFLTKNPKYQGFLYEDVIEPYFQASLAVESWGRPYQGADCPPTTSYSSVNIDYIGINSDGWGHYSDHSKWAITVGDGNPGLACLCDMNRMTSQERRGGSCLCVRTPSLYQALSNIVVLTDHCGSQITK